jgi:two-component system response regulator AlgR
MAKVRVVLIVEDELLSMFRDVIEIASRGMYEVKTAETGYEAVRKARLHNPDIILMDLNLPGMSGEEATRKIREFNSKVPIIVVTAYPHRAGVAMDAGATHYIQKPINIQNLLNVMERSICNGG